MGLKVCEHLFIIPCELFTSVDVMYNNLLKLVESLTLIQMVALYWQYV